MTFPTSEQTETMRVALDLACRVEDDGRPREPGPA